MIPLTPTLKTFLEKLKQEKCLTLENMWDAPKAFLISKIKNGQDILIISGGQREEQTFENFSFFLKENVLEFPSWETLPTDEITPSPDIIGKRMEVLYHISHQKKSHIILSSLQGVLQKLPAKKILPNPFIWKVHDTIPFDTIEKKLSLLGYKRVPVVSDKKEFALRGGILDLFPISSSDPFRVEFFGDTIESIRNFDPVSQKSVEKVNHLFVTAANELELLKKEPVSFLEYLPSDTLIVFDDLLALEDTYVTLKKMSSPYMQTLEEFLEKTKNYQKLFFTKQRLQDLSDVDLQEKQDFFQKVTFDIFGKKIETLRFFHPFIRPTSFSEEGPLLKDLFQNLPSLRWIFLYSSEKYKENLVNELQQLGIKNYELIQGYLSSGFVMQDIAVIPEAEISKKQKVRRQKWRSTYHTPAAEFHEILPGHLVVHFHSGIGKYLGTEKQKNHLGVESEFMVIEYASSSKLYVPMSQAHLISRYIGSTETLPSLSTLGSKRWHQIKAKAQKDIIGYAQDLLTLSAERQLETADAFSNDSDLMVEFEHDFPYVETPDQLEAIEAVKDDLQKRKPMDRLVLGDVGYGKTEVAMRAAFKTVSDGKKQVAVLVPTTVLAMQHLDTFKERMSCYPMTIEVLSRFQSPKENKATLKRVQEGLVDIVIGTHRILSKDVAFKNLGLIIIDEEQRFGVRSKEHLKKLKKEAHCLTLSATPIPRTLYMSLVSLRDMSPISTPPQDRLPIKTILAETDDEVIQNALLRELAREGQSYFIHNRVESIYKRCEYIQELVPEAKCEIVHGQMPADQVDHIFHNFKLGLIDILFATTIVENGIDVPNANTILIDRSDTYGLADLYQLRGRVGRWNRTAYAYFLTPQNRILPELSQKRLNALLETGGYGGGMKLAMRDLEIRGAGDLLGVQQSGQVTSIGFHLYCKLLKRTIESLKKQKPITFIETKMEFSFPAYLPENYINESNLRMEMYHRLGDAQSLSDVDTLFQEIQDRFGKAPESVIWLYHLTRIRVFASMNRFTLIKFQSYTFTAEQQKGKKLITKTLPLVKISDPKEFEDYVLEGLRQTFMK